MSPTFQPPFSYRAAADEDELEKLFRLRQQVFSRSKELWELVAGGARGLDVASHDLHAVHYGVFDRRGRAMATVRAVDRQPTGQTQMVQRVLQAHGVVAAVAEPFAMISQCDRSALLPVLEAQHTRRLHVVECGRLCVDPAAGAIRARIFRFLTECTLAAEFFGRGVDVMYALSTVPLFRYYRQFGFEPVPHVPEIDEFSTKVRGILSWLSRERLERLPLATSLALRAEEHRARGQVHAAFEAPPEYA